MLQTQRADRQSPGQTRNQEGSFVRTFEVTDRHAPKWVTTHERNYCRHKVTKIVVTLTPAPQHHHRHHHHHNLVASTKRGINVFDYGLKESLLVFMWCVVFWAHKWNVSLRLEFKSGSKQMKMTHYPPKAQQVFEREKRTSWIKK